MVNRGFVTPFYIPQPSDPPGAIFRKKIMRQEARNALCGLQEKTVMDYAVERDGGGTRILLENGERIMIKLVVGNIKPGDKNPDGSHSYSVQTHVAFFVEPATGVAVKTDAK